MESLKKSKIYRNPANKNQETPEFGLLGDIEGLDFLAKLM